MAVSLPQGERVKCYYQNNSRLKPSPLVGEGKILLRLEAKSGRGGKSHFIKQTEEQKNDSTY
ncbi:hypothetical protein DDU33_05940 [Actinobacillus porcitonsillarum]|uniref:Uncharacterized protein n=1 Tax=Actinobacillus porcitonsillarum TaxID=189834 RepID=A0A2U8FKN4_9PAST|nr:hypothetical protein DDU33_05940 [Actinobacillus porcitonsillarum]